MGAFRLLLAFGVLLAHMQHQIMPAASATTDFRLAAGIVGPYAVLWFYVISGFLISMVLDTKYSADPKGTAAFYKSRLLRIFPLWTAIFLFCAFVVTGSEESWFARHSLADAVRALALFGQDWRLIFSTYPKPNWFIFAPASDVSWTLAAELTFYLLAPFVLRSLRWSISLFLASLAVRGLVCLSIDPGTQLRVLWNYLFFPATLCFFLLGHLARKLPRRLPPVAGYGLLIASLMLSLRMPTGAELPSGILDQRLAVGIDNIWMYLSILLFAIALPTVFATTKNNRVSNFLGDLTYPLYLVGNICLAAIFATWSGPIAGWGASLLSAVSAVQDPYTRGMIITAAVTAFALTTAIVVHFAVERPIIWVFRKTLDAVACLRRPRRDKGLLAPREAG
jgi:peptidoglycan/LPS O-acetylase OafA/YrhL